MLTRKKLLSIYILIGILMFGIPLQAKVMPTLSIKTTRDSGKFVMDLSVEDLRDSAKAIEIGMQVKGIEKVKTLSWDKKLGEYETVVQFQEDEKGKEELKLYIVVPKDEVLTVQSGALEVAELTLDTYADKIEIANGYIKLIDANQQVMMYEGIEVNHSHRENNTGNDNNTGNGNSQDDNKEDIAVEKDETMEKTENKTFVDVPEDHWAKASIERMATKGIISGYDEGVFKPDNAITRAEFSSMLARAFVFESNLGTVPFKDVDTTEWYAKSIAGLYENGITSGRPDGTFGVQDFITNEEIASMLYRSMKVRGKQLPVKRIYSGFTDNQDISSYAQEAVVALYQAEIISGMPDGSYLPQAKTSRAQVAALLDRVLALEENK